MDRIPASPELKREIINKIAASKSYNPFGLFKTVHLSFKPVTGIAIAAALLLGIILSSDISNFLSQQEEPVASISKITVSSSIIPDGIQARVVGELVCVGCFLKDQYNADHDCDLEGHKIGFLSNDGNVWSFTHKVQAEELVENDNLTGSKVEIDGQLFYSAHYIDVDNYRFLENN